MKGPLSSSSMTIKSELLSTYEKILCCVSTRIGGVSPDPLGMNLSFSVDDTPENVNENRNRFFGNFGIKQEDIAFTRQVHGDAIRYVRSPGMNEGCDALMTNASGLFLTISVADCLPIFLFDPKEQAVASVHAGWRGSKLHIVSKTIDAMKESYNTDPKNLVAFIGPSAGACCYEVGEDVALQFDPLYVNRRPGRKPHLDLKSYNKDLLMMQGASEKNIEISPYCTICHPELFHSYRRDRERSGRMMGIIGIFS